MQSTVVSEVLGCAAGVEALVDGVDERSREWAFRLPRRSSRTVTNREEEDGSAISETGRARRNPACLRERLSGGASLPVEGLGRLDMRFGIFQEKSTDSAVPYSAMASGHTVTVILTRMNYETAHHYGQHTGRE
jgi:hypothetical protein